MIVVPYNFVVVVIVASDVMTRESSLRCEYNLAHTILRSTNLGNDKR